MGCQYLEILHVGIARCLTTHAALPTTTIALRYDQSGRCDRGSDDSIRM